MKINYPQELNFKVFNGYIEIFMVDQKNHGDIFAPDPFRVNFLRSTRAYFVIQELLDKYPWSLNFCIRITLLPLMVKDLVLCFPERNNFWKYMMQSTIYSLGYTLILVYIYQKGDNFRHLLDIYLIDQKVFIGILIPVSVFCILGLAYLVFKRVKRWTPIASN